MNIMFFLMMTASLILLIITAPESAYSIMLDGAKSSVQLALSLIAIYAIWLSVLKIMEQIGLNKFIFKLFKPITSRLFKGESDETHELITLNFSANLLGMGGVATPLGIKAMKNMQDGSNRATHNMILFMVINATSIQLLPTTIIGMRADGGSVSPSNIIIPSFVVTLLTTIIGIILCKICAMSTKKSKTQPPNTNSLSRPLNKDSLNSNVALASKNYNRSAPISTNLPTLNRPLNKDSLNSNIALTSKNYNRSAPISTNLPTLNHPLNKDCLTTNIDLIIDPNKKLSPKTSKVTSKSFFLKLTKNKSIPNSKSLRNHFSLFYRKAQ